MATLMFTKPELFLEKWAEVHELECAMKDVREKYARIFIDVLDRSKREAQRA